MVTKQHMEWAAKYTASLQVTPHLGDIGYRTVVTNAFVAFFKRWNPRFSESKFRQAAGGGTDNDET